MRSVLIPRYPGAFSALGLALAPVRREAVRSCPAAPLNDDSAAWRVNLAAMRREFFQAARQEMRAESLEPEDWRGTMALDLRYAGQSFALTVDCPEEAAPQEMRRAFHAAHRRRYGHASEAETVEMVAARFVAVGPETPLPVPRGMPPLPAQPFGTANVYFESAWSATALYQRKELAAGQIVDGPAVFLQPDATTLLLPNWRAQADAGGNLRLTQK